MKKRVSLLCASVLILALSLFALAACLPSNLNEGYNDDPRAMKDYPEYSASIYVQNGLALPYRLLSPAAEEGKKFPVLVFMHGSGERGINNKAQIYSELYNNFKEYQSTFGGFYLMLPQCDGDYNWDNYMTGEAGNILFSALDNLIERVGNVDTDRQYIGGLSLGGFGTISALTLAPERFAAAFSICGGGNFSNDNEAENALLFAELAKTPLLLAHGALDPTVPYSNSKSIADGVTAAGGEVRFETFPYSQHNIWNDCFANEEYWSWLFSHTTTAA